MMGVDSLYRSRHEADKTSQKLVSELFLSQGIQALERMSLVTGHFDHRNGVDGLLDRSDTLVAGPPRLVE